MEGSCRVHSHSIHILLMGAVNLKEKATKKQFSKTDFIEEMIDSSEIFSDFLSRISGNANFQHLQENCHT